MQSKHNLFKYSLKEAIINLIKIKSSDQMFHFLLKCEIERNFPPHPFYNVSGLLLKIFSIWLSHALGSGIDSENNKNPHTVISFSLYV
jgi:hypothetical protein